MLFCYNMKQTEEKIMKSARDITNMAATNRQAVYRYIKKHHIKEKTLDETGKRLYDDETAQKIVAALSKRQPRTGARIEFQTIKEQLNIKDEQLKTLNDTIKNLNTSIQELNKELAFEKQRNMVIDGKQQKLLEDNARNKATKELQEQRIKELETAAKDAEQTRLFNEAICAYKAFNAACGALIAYEKNKYQS